MSIRKKMQNTPVGLERNMSVSFWWFFDQSPARAVIESKIYDRYHDISLLIEIDLTKQTIIDTEIEERRAPFATCPGAISNYGFLNGIKFNRPGLEIAIREAVPKSGDGCIRIDQLLFYAVDNFVSALGYELKSRQIPDRWNEERHAPDAEPFEKRSAAVHQWWIRDRVMKNSCFTMNVKFLNEEDSKPLIKEPTITTMLLGLRHPGK
ncbi:DUF2889 domain-containing protein [Leptospira sp. 'Mane']|uniref:DUF2889 domain-containing protein n=1 Tax=Leptospira sp. 'Mane' TaxID=3387407 RepID=UPI00398B81D8